MFVPGTMESDWKMMSLIHVSFSHVKSTVSEGTEDRRSEMLHLSYQCKYLTPLYQTLKLAVDLDSRFRQILFKGASCTILALLFALFS